MKPITRAAILLILLFEVPPSAFAQTSAERVGITKQELLELINPSSDQAGLIHLIEDHGIGFEPSGADFKLLQALGASDVLLDAVRKLRGAPMAREMENDTSASGRSFPFNKTILKKLASSAHGKPELTIALMDAIWNDGIDFDVSDQDMEEFYRAGAPPEVVAAILTAPRFMAGRASPRTDGAGCTVHIVSVKFDASRPSEPKSWRWNVITQDARDWWEQSGTKRFPKTCLVATFEEADYVFAWTMAPYSYQTSMTSRQTNLIPIPVFGRLHCHTRDTIEGADTICEQEQRIETKAVYTDTLVPTTGTAQAWVAVLIETRTEQVMFSDWKPVLQLVVPSAHEKPRAQQLFENAVTTVAR